MVMACGGFWGFSQAEAKDVWVYTVPDSEFGAGYEVYVDDESIKDSINYIVDRINRENPEQLDQNATVPTAR